MEIVTQVSFMPSRSGIRISYSMTEVDDTGIIISTGTVRSHIADDQEAQIAKSLIAAIKNHIEENAQ